MTNVLLKLQCTAFYQEIYLILQAHSQAYVVKTFAGYVTKLEIDESVRKPLLALCMLYAVYGITEKLGEFIQVNRCCKPAFSWKNCNTPHKFFIAIFLDPEWKQY